MAGQKHSREFISDTAYETEVEKASRIRGIFNELQGISAEDNRLATIIKQEAEDLVSIIEARDE
jgi:hypothetical protein